MGKAEIKFLFKKVYEIGPTFMKVLVVRKTKEGEMMIEKWVRIAASEGYFDKYGNPDDEAAREAVTKDRHRAIKDVYLQLKNELESRQMYAELMDRFEEEESFGRYGDEMCANQDRLLEWCHKKARLLGIDVAHDQFYKSNVIRNRTYVGQKILSEQQVNKMMDAMQGLKE